MLQNHSSCLTGVWTSLKSHMDYPRQPLNYLHRHGSEKTQISKKVMSATCLHTVYQGQVDNQLSCKIRQGSPPNSVPETSFIVSDIACLTASLY